MPSLSYGDHLFEERTLTSVTANTRSDGEELLGLAETIPLRPEVTVYPFDAVDRALADLAADRVVGTAVVAVSPVSQRARASASWARTSAAARGEATWNSGLCRRRSDADGEIGVGQHREGGRRP